MSEFDFDKIQGLDLSGIQIPNPMQDMMDKINRDNQAGLRAIEETRREREAEALRRHEEVIAALKEAGEKGATIVVGDNATDIQIQQNSAGAYQKIDKSQGLDYDQTMSVLKEIRSYFEYPQFQQTFGENTENVKQVITDTLLAVENKEDEGLIKKSLHILKDLAIGAGGSMIASGILALLGTLPLA